MCYAAAESQEMDAPFNNNLPTPTNDVIVNPGNPVNPDSKPMAAARRISIDGRMYGCIIEFLYNIIVEKRCLASSPRQVLYLIFTPFRLVLNQDFQDFQDCRGRIRFGGKGYL
jgi:hypothetical protein